MIIYTFVDFNQTINIFIIFIIIFNDNYTNTDEDYVKGLKDCKQLNNINGLKAKNSYFHVHVKIKACNRLFLS